MSRHHAAQQRLNSLGELHNILSSMKTLAMLETHKLGRYQSAQARVVETMEAMAADFLGFHPDLLPSPNPERRCYLLLGSERGFCGDFNEAVRRHFENLAARDPAREKLVITVGHRLNTRMDPDPRVRARLPGATVVEEVDALLQQLIRVFERMQSEGGGCSLTVVMQAAPGREVTSLDLIPPFRSLIPKRPPSGSAPCLNLPPRDFFRDLVRQYLFAVLHACFYTSLSAENHRRMEHLEGATQHLQRKTDKLRLHYQYLRQEEITEEIEEVLLGAESLEAPAAH